MSETDKKRKERQASQLRCHQLDKGEGKMQGDLYNYFPLVGSGL